MADTTAISPHTSRCRAMFWWTRCVGCGQICGGRRRCSETELSLYANWQGHSDCGLAEKAGPGHVGGGAAVGRGETKDTGYIRPASAGARGPAGGAAPAPPGNCADAMSRVSLWVWIVSTPSLALSPAC